MKPLEEQYDQVPARLFVSARRLPPTNHGFVNYDIYESKSRSSVLFFIRLARSDRADGGTCVCGSYQGTFLLQNRVISSQRLLTNHSHLALANNSPRPCVQIKALPSNQAPGKLAMGLNIGASSVQLTLFNNNEKANRFTSQATNRLATGLRINSGSDDPAGLIAAEELKGDLIDIHANTRVLQAQERQSNIQQSGRSIATSVLQEIRGLYVQASSGTNSEKELEAIQLQIDSSLDSLDRLGKATGFAIPDSLDALRSDGEANVVSGDAAEGVELLDEGLNTINMAAAAAGAYQKYTLEVDQQLAEARAVATASAYSQVADADYVEESSNLVTGQILSESSIRTMVLAQSIKSDQMRAIFENL